MNRYRYRLFSTEKSSAYYGPCQVCRNPCSDVFSQIEERRYLGFPTLNEFLEDAAVYRKGTLSGWTHEGCFNYYGHKECLESKQRYEDCNMVKASDNVD